MKTIIRTILFITVVLFAACNEEQPQPMSIQDPIDTVINIENPTPVELVGTSWYAIDTAYQSYEETADSIYIEIQFTTDTTYELYRYVHGRDFESGEMTGRFPYTKTDSVICLEISYNYIVKNLVGTIHADSIHLEGDRTYYPLKTCIQ